MLDNWDFSKSDGRPAIMEGPHGGGRAFSESWAEWNWRERFKFIAAMLGVAAFFVGLLFLTFSIAWPK